MPHPRNDVCETSFLEGLGRGAHCHLPGPAGSFSFHGPACPCHWGHRQSCSLFLLSLASSPQLPPWLTWPFSPAHSFLSLQLLRNTPLLGKPLPTTERALPVSSGPTSSSRLLVRYAVSGVKCFCARVYGALLI